MEAKVSVEWQHLQLGCILVDVDACLFISTNRLLDS